MALSWVFPPTEHNMDTDSLMRVLPEELGNVLLQRRLMLKDTLPGVIRNLEAEEDIIAPKVEKLKSSFSKANKNVSIANVNTKGFTAESHFSLQSNDFVEIDGISSQGISAQELIDQL